MDRGPRMTPCIRSNDASTRNESRPRRRASAFTVTEVLVSLAIIALILALLLPAIQRSRESARLISCRNNLHNIGVALHAFEATHGHFPAFSKAYVENGYGYSCLVQLLPHMDQANSFHKLDYSLSPTAEKNLTATQQINGALILQCPSDHVQDPLTALYLGNRGTGVAPQTTETVPGLANQYDGFLGRPEGVRASSIFGGLSNTAAFSECRAIIDPADGLIDLPMSVETIEDWQTACQTCAGLLKGSLTIEDVACPLGWVWTSATLASSTYNHVLTPGNNACDFHRDQRMSVIPPSSRHSAGVNLLRADGSAAFQSKHVDAVVWRDLGSRD